MRRKKIPFATCFSVATSARTLESMGPTQGIQMTPRIRPSTNPLFLPPDPSASREKKVRRLKIFMSAIMRMPNKTISPPATFSNLYMNGPMTAPKREERIPMATNARLSPATISSGLKRLSWDPPVMIIGRTGKTQGERTLARPAIKISARFNDCSMILFLQCLKNGFSGLNARRKPVNLLAPLVGNEKKRKSADSVLPEFREVFVIGGFNMDDPGQRSQGIRDSIQNGELALTRTTVRVHE